MLERLQQTSLRQVRNKAKYVVLTGTGSVITKGLRLVECSSLAEAREMVVEITHPARNGL